MVDVVAEKGYEATTIHEVVGLWGFGKGTYYKLFPTKEACFLAAFEMCAKVILARLEEGVEHASGTRASESKPAWWRCSRRWPRNQRWRGSRWSRHGLRGPRAGEAQVQWLDKLAALFAGEGKPRRRHGYCEWASTACSQSWHWRSPRIEQNSCQASSPNWWMQRWRRTLR